METDSTSFTKSVLNDFGYLTMPPYSFTVAFTEENNMIQRVLFQSGHRLILVQYERKEQTLTTYIMKKDTDGFWPQINSYTDVVTINVLFFGQYKQPLSDHFFPYKVGLQTAINFQADQLKRLATDIVTGKIWISREDILGKPKPITGTKVFVKTK